jgi:hypothetical protein
VSYFRNVWAAVMGRSASPGAPAQPVALERAYGSDYVSRLRPHEQREGVRTPWVPVSLRWMPEDIEAVWEEAEMGQFLRLGRLIRAFRMNGMIDGLMAQRENIVRLPFVFEGDPWLCAELRGVPATYTPDGILIDPGVPGAWDAMAPPEALKSLIYTGVMGGLAPFELVDGGKPDPQIVPRDLDWLRWDWGPRMFVYQGAEELYKVEPGNGRWGMFSPGGVTRPWGGGMWLPCSFPHVSNLAALFDRMRYQALMADPLKWIRAGEGAKEEFLRDMQWFIDNQWARAPGIALPKGYEAGVVETGGEGWKVYCDAEDRADRMIQIALAGQVVSVDGGSGFANVSIFDVICEAYLQETASGLARCLTEQVIGPWVERRYGLPRWRAPKLRWDVRSPARRKADAELISVVCKAVTDADAMLKPRGMMVDAPAYLAQNAVSIPVIRIGEATAPSSQLQEAPSPKLLTSGTVDVDEVEVDLSEVANDAAA